MLEIQKSQSSSSHFKGGRVDTAFLLTINHWLAGATQVKWNRKNSMTLASAHNGEVRIWDIRVILSLYISNQSQKVSSPTTFITAHMAKIYGIDWSYTDEHELVTCSEDKQVKVG